MSRESLTVIVPVLNEARVLRSFLGRLEPVLDKLDVQWELVFVDDGSKDETLDTVRQLNASDPRIKGVSLSRNFGQDIALAAGLRYAHGDAAILMDADLQHPPEMLEAFVTKWRQGHYIVYGLRVSEQETKNWIRRFASRLYYRLFNVFASTPLLHADGMGDFWLLDRRAIEVLNRMGEGARFTKGLCSWVGFRSASVPYKPARRTSGKSRMTYGRLARYALDGLISFSMVPLRVWSLFGLAISLSAICYAGLVLAQTLVFGRDSPGFPTLIISIMILGGIQLISLGVLGEYLGRIYEEVKRRPLFVVAEEVGIEAAQAKRALQIDVRELPTSRFENLHKS